MRIAIIEDNESVAKGIAYRLQDRGHATDIIADGTTAEHFLRDDANDLIVMDVSLPGLDGISLLRSLRARGDTRPVLMLTARATTEDRVTGLEAGADDYLTKPFDMAELEARLHALSRRINRSLQDTLRWGALVFDLTSRSALVGNETLHLPRRETAVIEALLRAEGRTIAKPALLEAVYGTGADVEESAVEVHVSRLRKRLRPHGIDIIAQRGLGYRLQAPR